MKNLIYPIFVLILIFSCDSDSTSSEPETPAETDGVLLTRIEADYLNEQFNADYNYDGNKLTSITSNNELITQYYYENDLLVKFDNYEDGELYATVDFTYENGAFVSYTLQDHYYDRIEISDFQFNSDGTIDVKDFNEDRTESYGTYQIVLDEKGNILQQNFGPGDNHVFTYDNMKNAAGNIVGIDILKLVFSDYGGFDDTGVVNNILSITENFENFSETESFVYQYNDAGYPISAEYYYDGEYNGTIKYFYD